MKYNYVFINAKGSYHEPLFSSLKDMDNVKVYENAFDSNIILKKLCFLHWSSKLNKYFRLPFKQIWFNKIYRQKFNNDKPLCFVFINGKYAYDDERLLEFIKDRNQSNRIAVIFDDLISKMYGTLPESLIHHADLICSYDQGECEKNGIALLENVYYSPLMEVEKKDNFDYDVYFLGYAKNRLAKIYEVWQWLTQNGVKCEFLIAGVDQKNRLCDDDIKHSSGSNLIYIEQPITYKENLLHVQNARCILEIIQDNSVATTLRANEAVCYKRKLITNCPIMKESVLYSPSNMNCYINVEEISLDFCKSAIDYSEYEQVKTLDGTAYICKLEKMLTEAPMK